MDALLNHKITHAVTEYDRRASTRKGYNMYALSIYLGACQETAADYDSGVPLRRALVSHFTGRLLDAVLKAVGEPKSTDAEQRY